MIKLILRKTILLILFSLPGIFFVSAQKEHIRFENLSRASGLSQSTVYSIVQDNYGFIWIGTADGLNRYDGYSLKKYFYDAEKPNSISNNRIYNLLIDSDGELWIATLGGGLNKYRHKTDDFIAYRHNKDIPNSISNDVVMSLYEDKKGDIWIGTAENGLNQFDKKSLQFKRYINNPNDSNSLAYKTVISIAADKKDNLWLALNEEGIDYFDREKQIFTHYRSIAKNNNSLSNDRVNHVLTDSQGMVWISTDFGLNLLNPQTSEIKRLFSSKTDPYSIRANEVYSVFEDKEHNIWVGTYGGLSLLTKENRESFKFQNYTHNPLDFESLSGDLIRCIYQDKSEMFWVGNFSTGLDRFVYGKEKFDTYRNEPDNANSLSNNIVRCFNEDAKGNIWIGTYIGGLNCFNPKTRNFEFFQNISSEINSINQVFVNAICIDVDDNLWIGTWGAGLYYYNQTNGITRHYINKPDNPNSINNNLIRSMLIDKKGILWIATSGGGLNRFDPLKEEFVHYKNDKNNPSSISDNRVMGLLEDHRGNLWIGASNQGLNMFIESKNSFLHFRNNPDNPKSIGSNRVYCIYETKKDKTIWIGTGNGLDKFNSKDSTFTHFTKKNGFRSEVILGILEDNSGKLWISTSDGLCKFDPEKGIILKQYDEFDGLQSGEFNEGAYYKDSKGNLYFGGIKGFSVFNPDKIQDNPIKPICYLVDFQIFNKSVPIDSSAILKQNIILTKEIHLDYNDYVFSFEFSALNYNNPGKNQYLYKLDGFDEDWILTDAKRRFVTYTNLDPREYTFMVKASNNDGVWSEESTNVKIIIHPPLWKELWFQLLIVILLVGSLFSVYFYRTGKLKQQQKRLEKAVDEKTHEVIMQKEKLQMINQELLSSNTELHNQHQKLENTLNSLQKTQNQLIQSEKMASLGILAAGVAHEINNPLNFIQGSIFRLENYFNDNLQDHINEVAPMFDGVQTGISRAEAIVASLNHYSRQNEVSRTKCNIHIIVDNCLNILQSEIKHRIEVIKEYTSGSYNLMCNEGKLHQAILNIIANACQSIENKGKITISTKILENTLQISISDTGSGIKKEDMPRIFDPFFTTKEPGKGTGLGLSITYNIIQEHNGNIEFVSNSGTGTIVLIKLPLET